MLSKVHLAKELRLQAGRGGGAGKLGQCSEVKCDSYTSVTLGFCALGVPSNFKIIKYCFMLG